MSNNIDDEWVKFLQNMSNEEPTDKFMDVLTEESNANLFERSECKELYISTQTKIFFLNQQLLDVSSIFWNLPII
jgi:hypothetical protein